MSCAEVREYLPWLLNKSLPDDRERQLRQHLAGCERCSLELRMVAETGRLFETHPPAQDLALMVMGAEPLSLDRDLVTSHLEECASCRSEVEMIRADASDAVSDEDQEITIPKPWVHSPESNPWTGARSFWQLAAVLALLVGSIFVGRQSGNPPAVSPAAESTESEGIARQGFEEGFVPTQMARKGEAQIMVFTDGFEGGDVGDWPDDPNEH